MSVLVEISGLSREFLVRRSLLARPARLHAVSDVSLQITRGETIGVVGESGCGKSTFGRLILRLIEPTSGTVGFDGIAVTGLGRAGLRRLRTRMQMVFQDPYSSLDPRCTIAASLIEPFEIQRIRPRQGRAPRQGRRAAGDGRARPPGGSATRTSSRAASTSASASPGRWRSRPTSRARRADRLARRLDPGPDRGLLEALRARARPHLSLHLARPRAGELSRRRSRRSCISAASSRLLADPTRRAAPPYTRAADATAPSARPEAPPHRHPRPAGEVPSPLDVPPGCAYAGAAPRASDALPARAAGARRRRAGGHPGRLPSSDRPLEHHGLHQVLTGETIARDQRLQRPPCRLISAVPRTATSSSGRRHRARGDANTGLAGFLDVQGRALGWPGPARLSSAAGPRAW